MRLLCARGSAELREVVSGSATQGLWLRNGKVRSRVSGIYRSRFPGRRTVWEIRRGGRRGSRASDRAEKSIELEGLMWVKVKSRSSAMPQAWL